MRTVSIENSNEITCPRPPTKLRPKRSTTVTESPTLSSGGTAVDFATIETTALASVLSIGSVNNSLETVAPFVIGDRGTIASIEFPTPINSVFKPYESCKSPALSFWPLVRLRAARTCFKLAGHHDEGEATKTSAPQTAKTVEVSSEKSEQGIGFVRQVFGWNEHRFQLHQVRQ
jgi:hypothetical protein